MYNNTDTENLNDGSLHDFSYDMVSTTDGSYGSFHFHVLSWFKDSKTLFINLFSSSITGTYWTDWTIVDIVGVKSNSTIIDPVEHVNSDSGIEDTPVGHIIPYMGNTKQGKCMEFYRILRNMK